MKKNVFDYCFYWIILCTLFFSISRSIWAQTPEQYAQDVYNNNVELLQREDIRLLLPECLNTYIKRPDLRINLIRPDLEIILSTPHFLYVLNSDVDLTFIGLLGTDAELRKLFRYSTFFNVLKNPAEITELIKLIRDAPTKPKTLEIESGNYQEGKTKTSLNKPFSVLVKDLYQDPLAGVDVVFTITEGIGMLSGIMPTADTTVTVTTDEKGQAEVKLTLGSTAGIYHVEAKVDVDDTSLTQIFTAFAIATSTPIIPDPLTLTMFSGNGQSGNPETQLDNPLVVLVTDQDGAPVNDKTVTFRVTFGDGSVSVKTETTNANGLAETILTLGPSIGGNLVEVSVDGISEKQTFIATTIHKDDTTPPKPSPSSTFEILGNEQSGPPNTELPHPLVVIVRNENGEPDAGVEVTFEVISGGSRLTGEDSLLETLKLMTNAKGHAQTTLTLGDSLETTFVEVSVAGISEKRIFIATTIPLDTTTDPIPPPSLTLSIVSGNGQSGEPGTALPNPLVVLVSDQNGMPVEGISVAFSITQGEGTLSTKPTITDGNGFAERTLTFGQSIGATLVEVSVEGISEKRTFVATTTLVEPTIPITPQPLTLAIVSGNGQSGEPNTPLPYPLVVLVTDQDGAPVEGKSVTFRVTFGDGSLADQTATSEKTESIGEDGRAETKLTLGQNPGTTLVEVNVEGNSETRTFVATTIPKDETTPPLPSPTFEIFGNEQSGPPNTPLPHPLSVIVRDENGEPDDEVKVTFKVISGGGSLIGEGGLVPKLDRRTDANGLAQATLTLGDSLGTTVVEASVDVEEISEKAIFIATTIFKETPTTPPTPSPSSTFEILGNEQSGPPNTELPHPLLVIVKDENGEPDDEVKVTFELITGVDLLTGEGGLLTDLELMTDDKGLAQTTLTFGTNLGTTLIEVSVEGISEKQIFVVTTNSTTSPIDSNTPTTSKLSVSITPSKIVSPEPGKNIVFLVKIAGGENIIGYELTVGYDSEALEYFKPDDATPKYNCNYLPNAFQVTEIVNTDRVPATVTLKAISPFIDKSGDGILAKLIFRVKEHTESTLTLAKVDLIDSSNTLHSLEEDQLNNSEIILPNNDNIEDVNGDGVVDLLDLVLVAQLLDRSSVLRAADIALHCPEDDLPEDVNGDGVVNILDMILVANALGYYSTSAASPTLTQAGISATDVQKWLTQAKPSDSNIPESIRAHPDYQRGITVLENILSSLTQTAAPKRTALLLNYPNPFNPETWIPYQLAEATDVTVTIHSLNGTRVRTLSLGHQSAGLYRSKNRAAYWDGKNEFGECVASGLYFYTLTAGPYSATGKMLIQK